MFFYKNCKKHRLQRTKPILYFDVIVATNLIIKKTNKMKEIFIQFGEITDRLNKIDIQDKFICFEWENFNGIHREFLAKTRHSKGVYGGVCINSLGELEADYTSINFNSIDSVFSTEKEKTVEYLYKRYKHLGNYCKILIADNVLEQVAFCYETRNNVYKDRF